MKPKPIPKSILAPLAKSPWKHTDYDQRKFHELLELHATADRRDGITSSYCLYDEPEFNLESITRSELVAMVAENAIRPDFHRDGGTVNQHWLHSLEQFYAEVTAAWNSHERRTDALIGTAAGRSFRRD